MPPVPPEGSTECSHTESTPLLTSSSAPNPQLISCLRRDEEQQLLLEEPASRRRSSFQEDLPIWKDEFQGMVELALPVIGTYLLEMLPGLVSIILVGHITDDPHTEQYIDATALAVMFMNLTGMSIGIGLATAMDTLCSQAYGAKETHRMGTYLQTGIIVLSVFTILVGVLFYYCKDIFLALGQPPLVSELAGLCTIYLLPGVPFLFGYELLRKVLQAQNVANPMLLVSVVANLVNVGLGYYLVYHTSWGWLGVSLARTACNITFLLLLLPYTIWSGLLDTFWTGIHVPEAMAGIPQFLSLGIPGMLQLCFEWWAFEVLSLICGVLPNAVVAIGANAVLLNIASMVYMLYLGLSISCNVRVGNALGANDPHRASLAATLTLGMAALMASGVALALLLTRAQLPLLFTHDADINNLAAKIILVAAVFQLPDSINGTVQGIFRGSGRQSMGAQLNFVAYYLLGLPLGCFLAFTWDWGVEGLWMGMTVGLLLIAVGGTTLVAKSDWPALAKEAQARIQQGGSSKGSK